jgi:hypothetical protein
MRDEWTKLSVGCHWKRGPYTASSIQLADGSQIGYILCRDRKVLAEYVTWDEIERLVAEGR